LIGTMLAPSSGDHHIMATTGDSLARRLMKVCAWCIGGFLLIGAVGSMVSGPVKPQTDAERGAAIRDEKAKNDAMHEETERLERQVASDKARNDRRFAAALVAARAIKDNLRDPDSLVWESIRANDDATVLCIEYRARNGLGGMNREFIVYAKGAPSQKPAVWNKHCAGKSMYDMMSVKYAL
jgi:hypothetical protein